MGRAVISLHPVSSRSAGHFGSDRLVSPLPHYCWSRVHGRASAGFLVESQRWGYCSWFYRASWLVGGSPPTSPIALLLACRIGAPSGPLLRVFALSLRVGSPFRVGSVSVLDRIEGSCSTFLVCASSLRDGVTLSGRGLFQISIVTKTCLAHLPLWSVSGLRDGVTHFRSSGAFLRPRSERRLPPFIYP